MLRCERRVRLRFQLSSVEFSLQASYIAILENLLIWGRKEVLWVWL